MVYSWLKNVQFTLLPGRCVLCAENSGRQQDLCCDCEATLTRPWSRCQRCALPCAHEVSDCGQCSAADFRITRCEALAPYRFPIDQLIGAFKYQRQIAPGKALAGLLAAQLRRRYSGDDMPGCLIPVPLHWRRQWLRGFNQSHTIAMELHSRLDIPVADRILSRRRATPSQQQLDRKARQRNLKQAFSISRAPGEKHVALIDDVFTTGATCNQLAGLLLGCGVERVDAWCLARTAAQ